MRGLTLLAVVLAALYSGYWFLGARTVETQATAALQSLRDQGWQVRYDSLATRGFPSRFDTRVVDLAVTQPPTGGPALRYEAPFVQAFALSYQPNRVILALPEVQTVTWGEALRVTLRSDGLRASTRVSATTNVALQDTTVESGPIAVETSQGAGGSANRLLLALRPAPQAETSYDGFAELIGLGFDAGLTARLDPQDKHPDQIDRIALDLRLRLDRPLDRHLAAGPPARVEQVDIRDLTLLWGDMQLRGSGMLEVNAQGQLVGELPLTARNWREMIEVWVNSGDIAAGVGDTYAKMLEGLSGGADTVALPLIFGGGLMRLGIIPLGPAPRF